MFHASELMFHAKFACKSYAHGHCRQPYLTTQNLINLISKRVILTEFKFGNIILMYNYLILIHLKILKKYLS